jgi:hypothetical protein
LQTFSEEAQLFLVAIIQDFGTDDFKAGTVFWITNAAQTERWERYANLQIETNVLGVCTESYSAFKLPVILNLIPQGLEFFCLKICHLNGTSMFHHF